MYSVSDLRKGLKIEIDGDPYEVVEFQFVKPGKGQALYRCRIRNLLSGGTIDKTYRAAEKIDKPNLFEKRVEPLRIQLFTVRLNRLTGWRMYE